MRLSQWLCLWALSCLALGLEDGQCEEATSLVQLGSAVSVRAAHRTYWYPSRGVHNNRSGVSTATGPFPLPSPRWHYEARHVNFHQTPCIDDQLNVYTGSDNGLVFSFTKEGHKRWEVQAGENRCQNPFLFDGILYTACGEGTVVALAMADGKTLWRRKVCEELPGDTYTVSATEKYLVVPIEAMKPFGSPKLALLEREDGEVRWTYDMMKRAGTGSVNMAPCLLKDSIVTSDQAGGIYRLDVKDGSEIWMAPALEKGSSTLGGVACSDGIVFNGFSAVNGEGGLQALNMATGERIWTKVFSAPIHNAPAVGKIYGHDQVAVIVGMGNPAGLPPALPAHINGTVFAADAATGEILWTFEPPPWLSTTVAGSTLDQVCLPDLFSGATVGGDGTVYINWSAGGITYALRDANGDGVVALEDPAEVSGYDLGSGATGPPALAPGMLFVNTCRRPTAFLVEPAS
mmetsp:Transcript_39242/g.73189  ORF Transcript_39242/g.73189 Transcript_39242/m.73189 type:complete len:460 (-) Transcript_39242:208-1587(-)